MGDPVGYNPKNEPLVIDTESGNGFPKASDGLPKVAAVDPLHPASLERLTRAVQRKVLSVDQLDALAVVFPRVLRERSEAQAEVRRLEQLGRPRGWGRGW